MKAKELREKTGEDLASLLRERQERADLIPGLMREKKVKNVKERRAVKRDIARTLTVTRTGI